MFFFIGSNKIEYLPPEIFTPLSLLRELHLYKNKITTVPPEIGNLVGKYVRTLCAPYRVCCWRLDRACIVVSNSWVQNRFIFVHNIVVHFTFLFNFICYELVRCIIIFLLLLPPQPSKSCRWRAISCAGCRTRSPPAPPWRSCISRTTPSSPTFPDPQDTSGNSF